MINGNEYGFEDVQMVFNGIPLEGFIAFNYGTTRNHYNIHARGSDPKKMGRGKKDAKPSSITILQSQFDALVAASPRRSDPTDWVASEVVVSYAPLGGVITTDIIPNVRVNEWEKGMKTEDGHMTIQLNLTTGIVQLNV